MPSGFIYLITNTINDRQYVGQTTKTIEARWREHVMFSKRGKGMILCSAIRLFGPDAFSIVEIDRADNIDRLNELEQQHIAKLGTLSPGGYNLQLGGMNRNVSPETRAKMSATHTGMPSPYTGHKRSEAFKAKQSARMTGNQYAKGNKFTDEARAKVGAASRGRVQSAADRAKKSAAKRGNKNGLGHKMSEESKAKMIESLKRRWAEKRLCQK